MNEYIGPVSVNTHNGWNETFDDTRLIHPELLPGSPVSDRIISLYTNPRSITDLRSEMGLTEASIRSYFESLAEQQKPEQAKQVVDGLFNYLERLGKSTARKTVITYYLLGYMLNTAQKFFLTKSEYMIWIRRTFGQERHLENLRQARKLADLGEYTIRYAVLGKNRCLELCYLFKQHIKEENDLREYHEKEKLTEAEEAQLLRDLEQSLIGPQFNPEAELTEDDITALRVHMDTVLTMYRLKQAGIDSSIYTYDQAKLLALFRGLALEKRKAVEIKALLDEQNTIDEKRSYFDDWICNRMHIDEGESSLRPIRMRSILSYFPHWLEKGRQLQSHDIAMLLKNKKDSVGAITDAYRVILFLAHELGVSDDLELPETAIDNVKALLEVNAPSAEVTI